MYSSILSNIRQLNFAKDEEFNKLLEEKRYDEINRNMMENSFYLMYLKNVDEDLLIEFIPHLKKKSFINCLFRKKFFVKYDWYDDYINIHLNSRSFLDLYNSKISIKKIYQNSPEGKIYKKALELKGHGIKFLHINRDESIPEKELGNLINLYGIENSYILFKYKNYKDFNNIIKHVYSFEIEKCWDSVIFSKDVPTLLLEYLIDLDKARFIKLLPKIDESRFNKEILRKIRKI